MQIGVIFFVLLGLLQIVEGVNKVGQVCSTDSDCVTPGERCTDAVTNVDPPCPKKTCQCMSCFALAESKSTCLAVSQRNIGDRCLGDANEVYPDGAVCKNPPSTVTCQGTNQNGTCVWTGNVTFASPCKASTDCISPSMICDPSTQQCGCEVKSLWDSSIASCRVREFGDACSTDANCQSVTAENSWIGFTWNNGKCVNGACGCAGQATNVSYLDPDTQQVQQKTICVDSKGNVGAAKSQVCDVDPISAGSSSGVNVCAASSICYVCPETASNASRSTGLCRTVVKPFATTTDSVCVSNPETTTTAPPFEMVRSTPGPGYASCFVDLTSGDSLLTQIAAGNYSSACSLRHCSDDSQCFDQETCVMAFQCGRGICACLAPYTSRSGVCDYLSSTSTTSTITSTTSTTSTTTTIATSISTAAASLSTVSQASTSTPGPVFYGMPCHSDSDCAALQTTKCVANSSYTSFCICPPQTMLYNANTGTMCKPLDYGDPCTFDKDCSNGLYTQLGFLCNITTRRCDCSYGYQVVPVSLFKVTWGSSAASALAVYSNGPLERYFCISKTHSKIDLPVGSNCTIDIIMASSHSARICGFGLTCQYCPGDVNYGTCVNFVPPFVVAASATTKVVPVVEQNTRRSNANSIRIFSTVLLLLQLVVASCFGKLGNTL